MQSYFNMKQTQKSIFILHFTFKCKKIDEITTHNISTSIIVWNVKSYIVVNMAIWSRQ